MYFTRFTLACPYTSQVPFWNIEEDWERASMERRDALIETDDSTWLWYSRNGSRPSCVPMVRNFSLIFTSIESAYVWANKECRRMHLRIGTLYRFSASINPFDRAIECVSRISIAFRYLTIRVALFRELGIIRERGDRASGCVSVSASMDIEVHQAIASWQINREAGVALHTSGNGECYTCVCCHLVSDYSWNFLSYVLYFQCARER